MNRGQIEKRFRPGASSVVERHLSTTDEAPGRNVFSICPLFFFLVSYSPFCQSACLLKNIMFSPITTWAVCEKYIHGLALGLASSVQFSSEMFVYCRIDSTDKSLL